MSRKKKSPNARVRKFPSQGVRSQARAKSSEGEQAKPKQWNTAKLLRRMNDGSTKFEPKLEKGGKQ